MCAQTTVKISVLKDFPTGHEKLHNLKMHKAKLKSPEN